MSFETSFLSTSTTNRKVKAQIKNVTTSTSQTLALSNAGNDYTLSSLSASVGDTIVITFYYTDGESRGKNLIRLKQIGGTSTTATIGGIYTGGSISAVQNSGTNGGSFGTTMSGFPNPSTNNTFTISTSTQTLGSSTHEAVRVLGSDPGDRYQVGFSFTVTSGTTEIQLQNEDDDDEESYTTQVDFPLSVSAAVATGSFAISTTQLTEGNALTVSSISTSISGSYYLKLFRNNGDSPDNFSVVTRTFTGTSTANFTTTPGNQSQSEIGYQGESFTWVLKTGTNTSEAFSAGTTLDSKTFTLYDDEHGTSVSNVSIGSSATSFTAAVVSSWSGTNTVAARIRNTSTNTVVKTFNITTNSGTTNVSVTSGLPAAGSSNNYRVEVYNGLTYLNGDTFSVTKAALVPTTPTDIAFSADPGTASATVSIACTASGGVNGTLQVSDNNSTWYSNGTSFTFTRGSAKTIYARRTGAGGTSSSYSESNTVSYIAKDSKVDLSPATTVLSYNQFITITFTISNSQPNNEFQLRSGNANLGTVLVTGSNTSGTINVTTSSSFPSVGGSVGLSLYGRVPTNLGGDGIYAYLGDSASISRNTESVTQPQSITFGADPGTFSSTVLITATASGGSGGTLQVGDGSASGWTTNGSSFTFTRGTAKNIYARRVGEGATSPSLIVSHTVNKLATDTSITASPSATTLAPNSSASVTVNISNATQQHTYHLYKQLSANSYQSLNINTGTLSGSTGSVTIPTSSLPTAGTSTTYVFYGILPTSSGGLGLQQITNGTFTISRTAEDVTPNDFSFTDVTEVSQLTTQTSNTITVGGLSTGTSIAVSVSGGTYSKNGGSYTAIGGTASNGDTFSVQHQSSPDFNTPTDTTLTIGNKSDTFTSTTIVAVAPVTSVVTFDNPASANTTATVGLSNTGGGGTLQYACELNNSAPSNWQAGNTFTISRGSSGTVYARARRSTTTVSNTVSAARPGFLDPDITIADINNQNFVNGAASSFITNISGGTSNTVYQVRETSNSGTVLASRTGDGNITVNDIPANNSIKTYYVTAYRTTASGGGGSGVVSAVQTFTVTVGAVTSSGGAGTAVGTSNYGVSVFGPDGTTVVWGTNNRQTNLEVNDTTTYTSTGTTSKTFTVANANDATKVIVAVGVPNPTTGPQTQAAAANISVTKTSTSFTVSVDFSATPITSITVRALAARIA